jgi:signal peptidase I
LRQDMSPYICIGNSMYPTVRVHDIVHVSKCSFDDIRTGDVIVFINREENKKIVHRVIKKAGKILATKGDNNFYDDMVPVRPEDIIGRVTDIERRGRKIRIRGSFSYYISSLWKYSKYKLSSMFLI